MEYMPLHLEIALISVFAQVALTFYAVLRMGMVRLASIRDYEISLHSIAIDSSNYPENARKHANNLANQFEFPILLYVAVMLAVVFDVSSMPFAISCAGFVISRYFHRFVHVRRNNVRIRFVVFLAGIGLLALAWIFLGYGLVTISYIV